MITIIINETGKYPIYYVVNQISGKCYGSYLNRETAEDRAEALNAGVTLNNLINA